MLAEHVLSPISTVYKLPLHRPLGGFCPPNIVSARALKLSSCLIARAFSHLCCARCPPVWLVFCIVSPATDCKLHSILAFRTFIFSVVKVVFLCGILFFFYLLPRLNCLIIISSIACMLPSCLVFWGVFPAIVCKSSLLENCRHRHWRAGRPLGLVSSPGETLPQLSMTIRRKPRSRKGYISILSKTILTT